MHYKFSGFKCKGIRGASSGFDRGILLAPCPTRGPWIRTNKIVCPKCLLPVIKFHVIPGRMPSFGCSILIGGWLVPTKHRSCHTLQLGCHIDADVNKNIQIQTEFYLLSSILYDISQMKQALSFFTAKTRSAWYMVCSYLYGYKLATCNTYQPLSSTGCLFMAMVMPNTAMRWKSVYTHNLVGGVYKCYLLQSCCVIACNLRWYFLEEESMMQHIKGKHFPQL